MTKRLLTLAAVLLTPAAVGGQVPEAGEVRQIVTFRFQPGRSGEAIQFYADSVIPFYRLDRAMKSFRAYREVESPVPLDLMVVSAFDGMAGMDGSNDAPRQLTADAGTSIGALYGRIGSWTVGHTDQFIRMLPTLGSGDPSQNRLTAFVWYEIAEGREWEYERFVREILVPWERVRGQTSSTGRFLLSDGWHYLRQLGFENLGAYQQYQEARMFRPEFTLLGELTERRREVIVAGLENLRVR